MAEPTLAQQQAQYLAAKAADRTGFLKAMPTTGDGFDLTLGRAAPETLQNTFGPWIDEDSIQGPRLDLTGLDDDRDLASLQGLHSLAVKGFLDMVETFAQVRDDDDPTLNVDGRLKVAARIIEPRLNSLATLAERELATVDKRLDAERSDLDKAMGATDPSIAPMLDSIRRHWEGKGDAWRSKQAGAPDRLDDATLQALATGPAYLTGLSDQQQARVREEWASRRAPDTLRRIAALERGRTAALRAITTLSKKADKFLDFKKARALIEQEAQRNARYGVSP